jgi:integrase
MIGSIHSDQKCPVCAARFVYDQRRRGLFCPDHPQQRATSRFRVYFGRGTQKRFRSFEEAERFLTGIRYETDRGTFDARDYKKDNPLGFETLAEKWLKVKEQEVKPRSYANLERYMRSAMIEWGGTNIKLIGYGEIEDFLHSQKISDKTRSNIKSCLHTFWTWLRKRKVITLAQFPEFPEVKFNLAFRNLVDKETQQAIINEVKRLTNKRNPKIWIAIKWLSTYIAIRPHEMLSLTERDIDTRTGYFFVRQTKEGEVKPVPMLQEDKELVETFPVGLPHLYFFRHVAGVSGVKGGQRFGDRYLYKWWKKACANLGIEGVDLYGGTRHSSVTALRKQFSPEQIKAGTMHSTNKAFDRYLQIKTDDALTIYEVSKGGKPVANKKRDRKSTRLNSSHNSESRMPSSA